MTETTLNSKNGITVGELIKMLEKAPRDTEIDFWNDGDGDFENVAFSVTSYGDVYDVSVSVETYNTIY